jgi:Protein of unknown function DUF86
MLLLKGLADRATALSAGLDEALQLLGSMPLDAEQFAGLDTVQSVAATALLKRVEQLEDVLMRLFRTLLRVEAVDTAEMFNRDVANHMEKLGVLPDAERWMTVVRLRNRLVHEYLIDRDEQRDRVNEAHAAVPILKEALASTLARIEGSMLP